MEAMISLLGLDGGHGLKRLFGMEALANAAKPLEPRP